MVFSDGSPQVFWFAHRFGVQGDPDSPSVPAGQLGVVDRRRLKGRVEALESKLKAQGCALAFENDLTSAWAAPPP